MSKDPIVDVDALLSDLRLAVAYAARAGMLNQPTVLHTLKAAEAQVTASAQDIEALALALNDVSKLILPMTVADLRFGRDPFSELNQKCSVRKQLWLTVATLLLLLSVGDLMLALRREQDALATLQQVQALRPAEKLTALRKQAQYESPLKQVNVSTEQFHQRIGEIRAQMRLISNSYEQALEVAAIPAFPPARFFDALRDQWQQWLAASAAAASGPADTSGPSADTAIAQPTEQGDCAKDSLGNVKLPRGTERHPEWLRVVMVDAISDFCFAQRVLDAGNAGSIDLGYALPYARLVKEKIALRTDWLLPFAYGLLGSMLFVLRNVASVRTPTMKWFPIFMRVGLGGVAGIVVGWFASPSAAVGAETVSTLSLPFMLAFLAGYGIEAVFRLLDRLSRALGDAPKTV